jgi:hypothetical protein
MSPSPNGTQLQPPGGDPQGGGPPSGGGFPSPNPAVPDPNQEGQRLVTDLVAATRRIGMKYPATLPETREVLNLAQKMLQKLVQSQPAPEPMAPPV